MHCLKTSTVNTCYSPACCLPSHHTVCLRYLILSLVTATAFSCWAPVPASCKVGKGSRMCRHHNSKTHQPTLYSKCWEVPGLWANEQHCLVFKQGNICCWIRSCIKLTLAPVLTPILFISFKAELYLSLHISACYKIYNMAVLNTNIPFKKDACGLGTFCVLKSKALRLTFINVTSQKHLNDINLP